MYKTCVFLLFISFFGASANAQNIVDFQLAAPVAKASGNLYRSLRIMDLCFTIGDNLLRAQGNIVVYYLLFKWAEETAFLVTRSKLLSFTELVKTNREIAEANYENADFDLLEYDRLTQQGTNDASNIRERLRILTENIVKV